jgi:hypothetical protein
MPTFELDFEVYCARCGAGLCNQSDAKSDHGGCSVAVEPCERCLDNANYEGYQRGRKEANDE